MQVIAYMQVIVTQVGGRHQGHEWWPSTVCTDPAPNTLRPVLTPGALGPSIVSY
jgi:hypothetical protein